MFQRDHPEKMKAIQRRTGEDTFLSEADRIKEENEVLRTQLEAAQRDLQAVTAEMELWRQRHADAIRQIEELTAAAVAAVGTATRLEAAPS